MLVVPSARTRVYRGAAAVDAGVERTDARRDERGARSGVAVGPASPCVAGGADLAVARLSCFRTPRPGKRGFIRRCVQRGTRGISTSESNSKRGAPVAKLARDGGSDRSAVLDGFSSVGKTHPRACGTAGRAVRNTSRRRRHLYF